MIMRHTYEESVKELETSSLLKRRGLNSTRICGVPALRLALNWGHKTPPTLEETTRLAVAKSPVLVGPDCPSGMEAAEQHILPRILKTHTQCG